MKTFVQPARLAVGVLLLLMIAPQSRGESDRLDLSGEWRLMLEPSVDPGDPPQPIDGAATVDLPGSLQSQGYGDPVTLESPWTPRPPADSDFYMSERYAPYRGKTGHKVPFTLQPNRMYVGAASYERTFETPSEWRDQRVFLCLERPHWTTKVWIDGEPLGSGESLSAPHRFELPADLSPGKHTIRVRVDNRLRYNVGSSAHSVSDYTQTNWNGIVGKVELRARPRVSIDQIHVTGDAESKRFVVRVQIGNVTDQPRDATLTLTATARPDGSSATASEGVTIAPGENQAEVTLNLGDGALLWDEFSPSLYDLHATLKVRDGSEHTRSIVTGLRDISVVGTRLAVNGQPRFLRGTLECCVFPKTGYPPTDVDAWKKLFRRCQEFGLNHVRFHSYCPPEAAFVAADELGIYLQPEAAAWTHVGTGKPIDDWIFAETRRILDEYGNHPSFIMMAYGNEPHGKQPARNDYLAKWVTTFRELDPRRVYACASGWPALPENDFHVLPRPRLHQWGEGMKSRLNSTAPTTTPDYTATVNQHKQPLVAHEIGQWCAYPNFDERADYDGVTRAENFTIFEDFLNKAGMGDLAEAFHAASGALQEECYKEEVEASLRTSGLAGFQLLGLSDFPGQGTALVGLCDAFWNVKSYASAERFRSSCDDVVALARLPQRVYTTNELLEASFEVANFGVKDLSDTDWRWRLDSGTAEIGSGTLSIASIPTGGNTSLGSISVDLSTLDAPSEAMLSIEGPEGVNNHWSVWVYPADADTLTMDTVSVHRSFDSAAREALAAGERVVLLADPASVKSDIQVGFTPIFWNTSYTTNQPPHTLGLLVDPAHRLFASFPTASHSDWQWWEVLHGCRAMELDAMSPKLKPLVRVIPDWFEPRRLALAFEARVGPGRLLACSANLQGELKDRHAARAFCKSLMQYAASDAFRPDTEVTAEEIASLFETTD